MTNTKWKPEIGDEYYQALDARHNGVGCAVWHGDEYDQAAYAIGDVFKTWEEAREEFLRRVEENK